jgi:hypothetical protein
MTWPPSGHPGHHGTMKPLGRYLTLAFLSALTAEFLLGDQWLSGSAINLPGQGAELVLYAAFYGSAAVLIREVARRTGRGWPTMLLLALAFGILEEGVVDQSLFNPNFVGEHLLRFGFIPALGIAGPWTIFVLSLHVIWSMGAPIAIAEAVFPNPLAGRNAVSPQGQAPWLRVPVIVVAAILFVVGGFAIFESTVVGEKFMAGAAQLVVSILAAAVLVVIAMLLPRQAPRGTRPFGLAAAIGVVATSAYVVLDRVGGGLSPWLECAIALAILGVGIVLAATLRLDVLGLAAGAILTYSWVGMSKAVPLGGGPTIEQSLIVIVVLATVILAVGRRSHQESLAN